MKPALLLAAIAPLLVAAQDSSSCPADTAQTIQQCTDQVYADEAKAPCSSSDWKCICQIQQGLISCFSPCPESQDYDAVKYNNENCKGQHDGVANAAGGNPEGTYTLSPITTTGAGSNGATPTAPNASSTASGATSATTGASSSSASASSSGSGSGSGSASAASSSSSQSSSPNAGAPAFPVSNLGFALVLGGLFLGTMAV